MLCAKCQAPEPTEHMTIMVGQAFIEVSFCRGCNPGPNAAVQIPINMVRCPRCGSSAVDVEERGIGCAEDYEIFASAIAKGLEKYHGKSQHVGKIPISRKLFI